MQNIIKTLERKKSFGLKLLILSFIILPVVSSDGYAQLPNVREAIEEKKKALEGESSLQAGDMSATETSLASAKMYNQLLTFKYAPSERDPFISSDVVSPFVTEEEQIEVTADAEQVNQAKKMIEGVVRNRIQLSGVAFGRLGANYTVAYADPEGMIPQVLRPGEYILIELGPEEAGMVDNAYQIAVRAGGNLKLKIADSHDKPAIMLKLLKIDGRTAEFENPTGEGSFPVEYKKEMIRSTGPQPKSVDR